MTNLFIKIKLEVMRFYYRDVVSSELPAKYFSFQEIEDYKEWGEEEEIAWRKRKGRKIF
jgi:hypothetical protein